MQLELIVYNIGTFTVDEEINQASTGVGKVVEWDVTNRILYYVQTRHNDALI